MVHERLPALRGRLVRLAFAWCPNREVAEDLAQEAIAKALERCRQLRDPGALEPWVFSILVNCHRDWLRRGGIVLAVDEATPSDALGPDAAAEAEELARRIRAALGRLPLAQRQVVTLIDLEGLPYAGAAAALGVPVGTVMSRLSRARAALRCLLAAPVPRVGVTGATRLERVR